MVKQELVDAIQNVMHVWDIVVSQNLHIRNARDPVEKAALIERTAKTLLVRANAVQSDVDLIIEALKQPDKHFS